MLLQNIGLPIPGIDYRYYQRLAVRIVSDWQLEAYALATVIGLHLYGESFEG